MMATPNGKWTFNGSVGSFNVTENHGKFASSGNTYHGDVVFVETRVEQCSSPKLCFDPSLHSHLVPPPELLEKLPEKEKQFLSGILDEQALRTVTAGAATSIIKFDTIQRSVCMIEGPECGSGFLIKTPEGEMALMSAGHIFRSAVSEDQGEIKCDFGKFKLFFGNADGQANGEMAIKRCTLGNPRGSIGHRRHRWFVPNGTKEPLLDEEDYAFLLLSTTEAQLRGMGLSYLECGTGDYLNYREGELVSIFGHPGGNAREGPEKSLRPLRMSFGKEKGVHSRNPNLLMSDYDSLGGNSGSPVIGRGSGGGDCNYAVKGIHVKGGKGRCNASQSLSAMNKWRGDATGAPAPVVCHLCETDTPPSSSPAVFYCYTCQTAQHSGLYLCSTCNTAQHSGRLTKHHTLHSVLN